jgi:hypothetical protein
MRRDFILPAAVLAGALALGCDDQPLPTASAEPAAPSFHAAITRDREQLLFRISDGRRIVFVSAGVEDLAGLFCTGADFDLDEIDASHLLRPDGSFKEQFKGNVRVVVVAEAAFDRSFCRAPSAVPTFTGTARFTLNDNDLFVTGHRADASMLHVTGTVSDERGQRYHLVASSQQVLAPHHPPPDVVVRHSKVKIQLTPIGH